MRTVDRIKSRSDRVRPSRRTECLASLKLGGTTVWGENEHVLEAGIRELKASIEQTAASHLTIIRPVLKKLVAQSLESVEMDDKVFSAVLGAALRSGRLDSVACSSINDRPYRILIHVSQSARWREASDTALELLKKQGMLRIRDLESEIFGVRAYNTYSSTSHVLARLNYLGIVRLADDGALSMMKDFA